MFNIQGPPQLKSLCQAMTKLNSLHEINVLPPIELLKTRRIYAKDKHKLYLKSVFIVTTSPYVTLMGVRKIS